jgi:hypothetical protein
MSFIENDVTFSGSTPVGGWVHLTVFADGSYDFSGHLHDSGFPSYDDSLVLGIISPSGVLYTFAHTGHVSGTDEPGGSRDDNWNVLGNNGQIAANWADLEGASGQWQVSTSSDWNNLLNQLQQVLQAAQPVMNVIQIVSVV